MTKSNQNKTENRQNITFGQLILKPPCIVRLHINRRKQEGKQFWMERDFKQPDFSQDCCYSFSCLSPSLPERSEQSLFSASESDPGLQCSVCHRHGHIHQHPAVCCESHISIYLSVVIYNWYQHIKQNEKNLLSI